jgi:hypothetical protein
MIHSPIGASSYHRWKECPGSVALSKDIIAPENDDAKRGIRAHDLAALWIKNRFCPKTKFDDLEQEDFDSVEKYVEFVDSLRGERDVQDIRYWVEHLFSLEDVYPGLYGTADFVCYSHRHEKLVVVDYKHGVGIPVEVSQNPQLSYYGIGALRSLNLPVKSVELIVVQPRCTHPQGAVRKWQTTPQALSKFLDQLVKDAKATESPEAELHVGDWCRYCPASAVNCPLIREKSLELAKENFATDNYDAEKLGQVLSMLPAMEGWIKNVKAFALAEVQGGKHVPGWKIVGKRPMRKWKEGWSGERLAQEFGLKPPEMFDQKVKSPAQVEKMIDKTLRARVEGLVDKVSSGYKLVESSDPEQELLASELDSFTILEI